MLYIFGYFYITMSMDTNPGSVQECELCTMETRERDIRLQLEREGAEYHDTLGHFFQMSSFVMGIAVGVAVIGLILIIVCVILMYH